MKSSGSSEWSELLTWTQPCQGPWCLRPMGVAKRGLGSEGSALSENADNLCRWTSERASPFWDDCSLRLHCYKDLLARCAESPSLFTCIPETWLLIQLHIVTLSLRFRCLIWTGWVSVQLLVLMHLYQEMHALPNPSLSVSVSILSSFLCHLYKDRPWVVQSAASGKLCTSK